MAASATQRWLADVGFGDSFRVPLRLDDTQEQPQDSRAYRIDHDDSHLIVMQREWDGVWKPQYRFTTQAYQFADFEERCRFQQTSPDSSFIGRRICTRAMPEGRITLSDLRLITTVNGHKQERTLKDEGEYEAALREHFGISLEL